jgi:putative ABC transport system ATP-binding protein
VSFAVPSGSFFAVIGPSGSGKSTVLNIVAGLDRPSTGRVTVGGRLITSMSDHEILRWRRSALGIVFEDFPLFPNLTAQENVLLALEIGRLSPPAGRRERSAECLRLMGVDALASCKPAGLSNGEQQRVAVARALASDPPVIIADEPTGRLDSLEAADVMRGLEELTRLGKTVLYATHDHELGAAASDHLELRDGRVVDRSYGAVPGLYA